MIWIDYGLIWCLHVCVCLQLVFHCSTILHGILDRGLLQPLGWFYRFEPLKADSFRRPLRQKVLNTGQVEWNVYNMSNGTFKLPHHAESGPQKFEHPDHIRNISKSKPQPVFLCPTMTALPRGMDTGIGLIFWMSIWHDWFKNWEPPRQNQPYPPSFCQWAIWILGAEFLSTIFCVCSGYSMIF